MECAVSRVCPTTPTSTTFKRGVKALNDPVNHLLHYTDHPAKCDCGARIECIQITEHMNFNLGNAIKYIWRSDLKGKRIEDLKKAVWYINREIARQKEFEWEINQ